ncbi:hypothetical protein [Chitinophaga rhizosphaerae]|uniref:hypothetical protein n=1 Tax=Chitinophaga rhizosphaerae TaxID=1864947 RepID=UPI000F8139D9|nr:hypothetical protein [Chitinophaga rhizosphaerae]
MNKILLCIILLLGTAVTTAKAQQPARKADDGSSIRQRIFSDYDQAAAKNRSGQSKAPKPKEATITSPQALKQHIFPGANGGGGIPRNIPAGARKANTAAAKSSGQMPSNLSAAEAAQKAQDPKAAKIAPADLGAQGKEPPLHFEKPKAPTSKN